MGHCKNTCIISVCALSVVASHGLPKPCQMRFRHDQWCPPRAYCQQRGHSSQCRQNRRHHQGTHFEKRKGVGSILGTIMIAQQHDVASCGFRNPSTCRGTQDPISVDKDKRPSIRGTKNHAYAGTGSSNYQIGRDHSTSLWTSPILRLGVHSCSTPSLTCTGRCTTLAEIYTPQRETIPRRNPKPSG